MNRRDFFKKVGFGLVGVVGVTLLGKPREEPLPLKRWSCESTPIRDNKFYDLVKKSVKYYSSNQSIVIPGNALDTKIEYLGKDGDWHELKAGNIQLKHTGEYEV